MKDLININIKVRITGKKDNGNKNVQSVITHFMVRLVKFIIIY